MLPRVYRSGHPSEGAYSIVVKINARNREQVELSHTVRAGFGEKCVIEDVDGRHRQVRLLSELVNTLDAKLVQQLADSPSRAKP